MMLVDQGKDIVIDMTGNMLLIAQAEDEKMKRTVFLVVIKRVEDFFLEGIDEEDENSYIAGIYLAEETAQKVIDDFIESVKRGDNIFCMPEAEVRLC